MQQANISAPGFWSNDSNEKHPSACGRHFVVITILARKEDIPPTLEE